MSFSEPFEIFEDWFAEAEKAEPELAEAMSVATTTADGFPSSRMVLLKGRSKKGFVFYTNLESQKGKELIANPNTALLFHWKSLNRQIRIEGVASQVSDAEADEYFASRPKDSQIGAWASKQSSAMEGRFVFEKEIAKYAAKYSLSTVPRPPHWSGFCVAPKKIEFWKDKPFRLHERRVFILNDEGDGWNKEILFP